MPGLRDATSRDVEDVDQCDYDLVADDDFVLGAIPGVPNAYVGVGWRGTGYKFAPWVGRVLAELALQEGTVYDIDRFDPARRGGTDEPTVTEDPGGAPRRRRRRRRRGLRLRARAPRLHQGGPVRAEVILDEPDALRQLHREFLRAGSDVMVALTYYAHREKLATSGAATTSRR